MKLTLARPARPFPVADRARDGDLYETEHPELVAIRFCREKICDNRAGLDPYDSTIFVLVARPHEVVFAERMAGIVGEIRNTTDEPGGGRRFRILVKDRVRDELCLDSAPPPIKADEPLASRGADAGDDAILRVLHPDKLFVDEVAPSQFRPAFERARQAAALAVDCGCGAPAGQVCRCDDQTRLETAKSERQVH